MARAGNYVKQLGKAVDEIEDLKDIFGIIVRS